MGRIWMNIIIFSLIFVLTIPLLLIRGCNGATGTESLSIEVFNHQTEQYFTIDLEEYIKGVIAAEISPKAPFEALKAQAIAARTYALYKGEGLTTDFSKDQGFIAPADLRERWGLVDYLFYWNRISAAVKDTRGILMVYEGKPIFAAYHANSGGATEDSEFVWGQELPYLKSKPSPFDQGNGRWREDTRLSQKEVLARLRLPLDELESPQICERSPSGRVMRVKIGDYILTGREVRDFLQLPSTLFNWSLQGEDLFITSLGRGHGVGMSQDGAVFLAEQGHTCFQILAYYYNQVKFCKYY